MSPRWTEDAEELDLTLSARGRRERAALVPDVVAAAALVGFGLLVEAGHFAVLGGATLAALGIPALGMTAFDRARGADLGTLAGYRAELAWQVRLLRAVPLWYAAPVASAQAMVLIAVVLGVHAVAPSVDLWTGLAAGALALHRAQAWVRVLGVNRHAADHLAARLAALPLRPVQ